MLGGDDADTQTRLSTMADEALRRTVPGQLPPGAFLTSGAGRSAFGIATRDDDRAILAVTGGPPYPRRTIPIA